MEQHLASYIRNFMSGSYTPAIKSIDAAIECLVAQSQGSGLREQQLASLYCNKAEIYNKLGLTKHCAQGYTKAIESDPDCAVAYLRLGDLMLKSGKASEAADLYSRGAMSRFGLLSDVCVFVSLTERLRHIESLGSPGQSETGEVPVVAPQPPSASVSSSSSSSGSPNQIRVVESPKVAVGAPRDAMPVSSTSTPTVQPRFSLNKQRPEPEDTISAVANVSVAAAHVAERGLVQHGVGNAEVDRKIALGYLQVNTGKLAEGIEIFNHLLDLNPHIVAAYLGRGTAMALAGDIKGALRDFVSAIDENPKCSDAYVRKGQALSALGEDKQALESITQAVEILARSGPPEQIVEPLQQRGLLLLKMHNYTRAMQDFKQILAIQPGRPGTWNNLGMCLATIGSPRLSIDAHARAVAFDPHYREAWSNISQAWKELGVFKKAAQTLDQALEASPSYSHAHYMWGMLCHGSGQHSLAIPHFDRAISCNSSSEDQEGIRGGNSLLDSLQMRGVTYHALGLFRKAVSDYDAVVKVSPFHVAWYHRECALYLASQLDTPLDKFDFDAGMDPYFKEAWCKRHHPATLSKYNHQSPTILNKVPDVTPYTPDYTAVPQVAELVHTAAVLGRALQYNSPGFLPNIRQYATLGIGALSTAQWIRQQTAPVVSSSCKWRNMYSIASKWRQISEPNDSTWWVDMLSPEQFEEGFGSTTPIITGQTNVVRYYPQFERAFGIVKAALCSPTSLNTPPGIVPDEIMLAKDCSDLWKLVQHDFWIVTPCKSMCSPGRILEGTRLTLQASPPEGFEFTIRTPGTPPRWKLYDEELSYAFQKFVQCFQKVIQERQDTPTPPPTPNPVNTSTYTPAEIATIDAALILSFYWYNFMPLSRGTAAVGYVCLHAMLLSIGFRLSARGTPPNLQVDWDAILGSDPLEFVETQKKWILKSLIKVDPEQVQALPIKQTCASVRGAVAFLNATCIRESNLVEDYEMWEDTTNKPENPYTEPHLSIDC
ncbi:TPR repeat protein [Pelomyxa schiedti]|nr:TPR repeat protein [Pelomyxa schiedti]